MNLFDLGGKVAVVTGSSRGIGRAIAERLAEHGAKVVVSSRNQDACDAVAAQIDAARGAGTAVACAANISRKDDLAALANDAFGRIDIFVCNFAKPLWDDPETLRRTTATTPLRRIGLPDEIAGAAVFLASPASSFMTGQTIVVDGA